MAIEYTFQYADTHVEVCISGVPDRPSLQRMWIDLVSFCRDNDCRHVLGVSTAERTIELETAVDYASVLEEAGLPQGFRIAWVQKNPAAVVMIELIIELHCKRFSGEWRVFLDEAEARQWLLDVD